MVDWNLANNGIVNWNALQTISNAILVFVLIIITAYYARQTRNQVVATQKQVEAMQNQVIHEQLIRKYEKLLKEMDDLVGPLFSKMDDRTAAFFHMVYHSSEGPLVQEIFAFWRDVKKNIYLAPKDLRDSLSNYLDLRQKFRSVSMDRTTPGEEATAVRAQFDQSIEDLKPKIKQRYEELSKQLEECEQKIETI